MIAAAALLAVWAAVAFFWWVFAFATPGPDSAWLKAAQSICFGTQADGLPSAWGWAVLILAPLSLLVGILSAYEGELRQAWANWGRGWKLILTVLAALLLFSGQGVWVWQKVLRAAEMKKVFSTSVSDEPLPESYPRLAKDLPRFKLTDQRGQSLDNAALRGKVHVLTFAYAHCATVCPFLVRDTLKAVKALPGVTAIFLTLDPWRDTPSALPSLAQRWGMGDESRLLSGAPKSVVALLEGLGVPFQRDALTGVVDHPPLVYVLDAQGRVAYQFNHPSPAWIQEAVSRLQKEG